MSIFYGVEKEWETLSHRVGLLKFEAMTMLTTNNCQRSLRVLTENFNVYLQLWIMSGPPLIPFHLTPMNLGIFNWIFALSSPPILCPPLPLKGVHQKLCATFCSMLWSQVRSCVLSKPIHHYPTQATNEQKPKREVSKILFIAEFVQLFSSTTSWP